MFHIGLNNQAKEYIAPSKYSQPNGKLVFLAGSIEEGAAENWQKSTAQKFIKENISVLNPRRENFPKVEQTLGEQYLAEQIMWELKGLAAATDILMYFSPNTKAPITLLELGLYANSKKLIVVCPEGFYRKANIEVVCTIHKIPLFTELDRAINYIIYK